MNSVAALQPVPTPTGEPAPPTTIADELMRLWQAGDGKISGDSVSGIGRLGQSLRRGVLDLLYPPTCPVTGENLADQPNPWLSRSAVAALPTLTDPLCPRCSAPIAPGTPGASNSPLPEGRCRLCAPSAGQFTLATCLWEYTGAGRELLLTYKFGGERQLARLLGGWLYTVARSRGLFAGVRWVVAMPASQKIGASWLQEDHSAQLAQAVVAADRRTAEPLELSWAPRALIKIRTTAPQATLDLQRRLTAPAESMRGDPRHIACETVVVVDDVLTTLATASEASRALLAAGAHAVRLLALARTL